MTVEIAYQIMTERGNSTIGLTYGIDDVDEAIRLSDVAQELFDSLYRAADTKSGAPWMYEEMSENTRIETIVIKT